MSKNTPSPMAELVEKLRAKNKILTADNELFKAECNAMRAEDSWQTIDTAKQDGTRILAWIPETDEHYGTEEIVWWGKHNHVPIHGWVYRTDRLGGEEVEGCNPTYWTRLNTSPFEAGGHD